MSEKCEKCGQIGTKKTWDTLTKPESQAAKGTAFRAGQNLNPYNANSHPLVAVLSLGFMTARAVLSTMYECPGCNHQWRSWF